MLRDTRNTPRGLDDIQDRVDAYIMGKMTDEQRRDFERELFTNAELRKLYTQTRLVVSALKDYNAKADQIRQWIAAEQVEDVSPIPTPTPWYRQQKIAACPASAVPDRAASHPVAAASPWYRLKWVAVTAACVILAVLCVPIVFNPTSRAPRPDAMARAEHPDVVFAPASPEYADDISESVYSDADMCAAEIEPLSPAPASASPEVYVETCEAVEIGFEMPEFRAPADETARSAIADIDRLITAGDYARALDICDARLTDPTFAGAPAYELAWRKANLLVALGDYDSALMLLRDIASGDGPYQDDAAELSDNLKLYIQGQ